MASQVKLSRSDGELAEVIQDNVFDGAGLFLSWAFHEEGQIPKLDTCYSCDGTRFGDRVRGGCFEGLVLKGFGIFDGEAARENPHKVVGIPWSRRQ